jgi:Sulfotransferase family
VRQEGDTGRDSTDHGKVRARTPNVSKFRNSAFDFSDEERRQLYEQFVKSSSRSRGANVAAFFQAKFAAWKDYRRSGRESFYVGYSPILVVDAENILRELPQAHFLHIVRNPWSAYADTKKRPVPLSLRHYMLGWTLNQYHALIAKERFPARFHIVRAEDVMSDPFKTLGAVCSALGLEPADSLRTPTWNGSPLEEIYPWGTIRKATPEQNLATAKELSLDEQSDIRDYCWQYLEVFNYKSFLS